MSQILINVRGEKRPRGEMSRGKCPVREMTGGGWECPGANSLDPYICMSL